MTPSQRREHKEANRKRRAVEVLLRSLPKPGSWLSRRKRFEALHDAWREANQLPPLVRVDGVPVGYIQEDRLAPL